MTEQSTNPPNPRKGLLSKFILILLLIQFFALLPVELNRYHIVTLLQINRIGIILNFLAGFMVAPDLIGKTRLSKLEALLEDSFYRFYTRLEILDEIKSISVYLSAISIIGYIIIWLQSIFLYRFSLQFKVNFFLIYLLISLILLIRNLTRNSMPISDKDDDSSNSFVKGLLDFIFLALCNILLFLLGRGVISIIRFLLSKLSGENKLESILIQWGIAFFIAGNYLQLLATFEKL